MLHFVFHVLEMKRKAQIESYIPNLWDVHMKQAVTTKSADNTEGNMLRFDIVTPDELETSQDSFFW